MTPEATTEFLEKVKDRWKLAVKAHREQYERSKEDIKFCDPANQWPTNIKNLRGDKPCLTVDVLTPIIKQIVNEQRQNRPAVKVSPVDDRADVETAQVLQGIVRHIEYDSDADVAYDRACESQVRGGIGFMRVMTEFSDPMSMEQDIKIVSIPNWAMVYLDPSSTSPDGSDAQWGFIAEDMTRENYIAAYPDSDLAIKGPAEWVGVADETPDWMNGKEGLACRVLEYFEKTSEKATIYKLEDGRVVTEVPEGAKSIDKRETYLPKCKWYKLNAVEVLEETEWGCEWVPIIPVYGDELIVDGKKQYFGIVHRAKDVQMMVNVWKSVQTEVIGLSSKAPWIAAIEAQAGHEDVWSSANTRDWNALPWNAWTEDGRQIPEPRRDVSEPPIQAITMALQGSMADIKAVTGMYDPNLGVRDSASQSGIAIRNLQHQGQVGNFHFQDNVARSMRHLGRILVALIQKYYDTARISRTIGVDDAQKLVLINGAEGQELPEGQERHFDLTTGRYDVTVSVGPSFTSKRQENLATLLDFQAKLPPEQSMIIADLIASQVDAPIAEEIARRLKLMLPPQLSDEKGQQQIPPQVMAQMQGMQQTLQAMSQQHEALTARVHELTNELESERAKLDADIQKAEIDAMAKVKVAETNAEAGIKEAEISAGIIDLQGINAYLAKLEADHLELQNLVAEMHDNAIKPAFEEAGEPVQTAPAMVAGGEPQETAGPVAGMEESNE